MSQPAGTEPYGPYVKNGHSSEKFVSSRIGSRHRQMSA